MKVTKLVCKKCSAEFEAEFDHTTTSRHLPNFCPECLSEAGRKAADQIRAAMATLGIPCKIEHTKPDLYNIQYELKITISTLNLEQVA